MVDREITDGTRIATLLKAEIRGRDDASLGALPIEAGAGETDADHVVDRFTIHHEEDPVATVVVQPDRLYLDFERGLDAAIAAASEVGLRTRPKSTTPPGLLVFVERGAEVKRAVDVLLAAIDGSSSRDR